jgi:hypothetical protein
MSQKDPRPANPPGGKEIRKNFNALEAFIKEKCPDNSNRSQALLKLNSALWWALESANENKGKK